jgi:hypothetical protein
MRHRHRNELHEDLEIPRYGMGRPFDVRLDGDDCPLSIDPATWICANHTLGLSQSYAGYPRICCTAIISDSPRRSRQHMVFRHSQNTFTSIMLSESWLHSSAESLCVSTCCESFIAASVSGVYTIQVVIALQVLVNIAITILVSTQCVNFETL